MKTLFSLAFLGLSLLLFTTLTEAASAQPAADAKGAKMVLADRDGDGLSDHLQQRLATLTLSEQLAVVVTFSAPGNAAAAQRAVGPFKVKREFAIINGFAATMTAGQAKALAKTPGVFRVEEDFKVTTMINAANSDFGTAAARNTYWVSGAGVGICVVDTGVDPGHEQLDGGKVAAFSDYVNGQAVAYDDHGHGTHVAAIAAGDGTGGGNAATFKGVAPGATIYAAKVLDSSGSGTDSSVIAGVEWCADLAGVQVISMSLGSAEASDGKDALSQAVNSAVSAGKVVVVAAGNSGDGEGTVGSPGAAAGAITVGAAAEWSAAATAANHSKGIYLAPFSSRGPTLDGRQKPDILAPGVSVTSAAANTANGYATWSGTSMATPFVSGTVALALQGNSVFSPAAVKTYLVAAAQDRGPAGTDNDWGAGLLDGYKFVANAFGDATAAPISFPRFQRGSATVPTNGTAEFAFDINAADLGVPIASTLIILNGEPICLYGSAFLCDLLGGWAWSPDIDAELIHPNGSVLASSECPLSGDCGAMGRQETLYYLPNKATDIGTYRLRMYQFSDDPGGAQAGLISINLSTGPVLAGPPPENYAPIITSSAPLTATEDLLYSYAAAVEDMDGPGEAWDVRADDSCGGVITAGGVYSFTPFGPAPPASCMLSIQVCDGGAPNLCDDEVATIIITAVNDPPLVKDDSGTAFGTSAGTPFTTGNVLANDLDPEGSPLTIINYATATIRGGSVSYQSNGTFYYVPPAGFNGTDSFTYYANDGIEDSDLPATVTINVTPATSSLHVGDLDGSYSVGKRNWTATVTITVHNANEGLANGAVVSGSWAGGNPVSCTTSRKGQCKLSSSKLALSTNSISFTVATVNGVDTTAQNHDPDDGDSNGTLITVYKPQ